MLTPSLFDKRRFGILLHPSALPSGTLADAPRFLEVLAECAASVWQMLPIHPHNGSPYQAFSAHAGNPQLIDWKSLIQKLGEDPRQNLKTAAVESFFEKHDWLMPYCRFMALKQRFHQLPWWEWPAPFNRYPEIPLHAWDDLKQEIQALAIEQWAFFQQWQHLREAAQGRDIKLVGDLPIFVAHDSADAWSEPHYFDMAEDGRLQHVAGVPPDYFSATGQRWGNPLYRWSAHEKDQFSWWVRRFQTTLALFDSVRIDHFRGFAAFWEIPSHEPTAIHGHWVKAPGEALFKTLSKHFGTLPLIAEDLGIITEDVVALRKAFAFPGMAILQFAFSGAADNPYLLENQEELQVVYTGTHDNDTTLGWFLSLSPTEQAQVQDYLQQHHCPKEMPWGLIELAFSAPAVLAIFPWQDILGLGSEGRFNTPGSEKNNWQWRFRWGDYQENLSKRLKKLAWRYQRDG
jgi:4-alpha-glucanotransferase